MASDDLAYYDLVDSNSPEKPARREVLDMFGVAIGNANKNFPRAQKLVEMLVHTYRNAMGDCLNSTRHPAELLVLHLRGERLVLDAYNKHRLNDPNDKSPAIPEAPASYPLRSELLLRAHCRFPPDILRPIYQPGDPLGTIEKSKAPAHTAQTEPKRRSGPGSDTYNKLDGSPASNIILPNINMTIAEVACFHPHMIKAWGIIDRFIGNGGTQFVYSTMINHFREMERGQIPTNTVYHMLKGSMKKRAKQDAKYNGWTTKNHANIEQPDDLDLNSLNVSGFRAPPEYSSKVTDPPSMPFKNLAKGVKTFPTGLDALDLTRAVQYCVDHPDEHWLYPDDAERLIAKVGPAQVLEGHRDPAAIRRHASSLTAPGAKPAPGGKRKYTKRTRESNSEEGNLGDIDISGDETDVDYDLLNREVQKQQRKADLGERSSGSSKSSGRPGKRAKLSTSKRSTKLFNISDTDSEDDEDAYMGEVQTEDNADRRQSAPRAA